MVSLFELRSTARFRLESLVTQLQRGFMVVRLLDQKPTLRGYKPLRLLVAQWGSIFLRLA